MSGACPAVTLSPSDLAEQSRHYGERVALVLAGSIRISFGTSDLTGSATSGYRRCRSLATASDFAKMRTILILAK